MRKSDYDAQEADRGSDASEKRVLIYATTAYMIDQFNMMNIRMLQEMGYTVDAACNFEYGNPVSEERIRCFRQELTELGVRQYQLPLTRNIFDIVHNGKALSESVRIMKERRYAFVHCHTPVGSVIARLACRMTGTKVIYTAHGFHFFDGAQWINWAVYYPIERLFSRVTDVLITINREDYERAGRKFHMKSLVYLPGIGVDTDRYRPVVFAEPAGETWDCESVLQENTKGKTLYREPKIQNINEPKSEKGMELSDKRLMDDNVRINKKDDIRTLRSELGADDCTMLLLSVGELSKRKNHMAVLRALKQIIQTTANGDNVLKENSTLDFRYIIAGTGVLKSELQKYIDENGLTDIVTLLGYRTDVEKLYRAADAFIFPSLQEGLPAALMQAMASELPASVSRIRGNADLIDENGGFLFDLKDEGSIEKSIISLMASSEKVRREMGKHNRAVILKGYSLEAVRQKTREIYTELV